MRRPTRVNSFSTRITARLPRLGDHFSARLPLGEHAHSKRKTGIFFRRLPDPIDVALESLVGVADAKAKSPPGMRRHHPENGGSWSVTVT